MMQQVLQSGTINDLIFSAIEALFYIWDTRQIMDAIALALIATVFYLAAASYQFMALRRKAPVRPSMIQLLGSAAALNHGLSVWLAMFQSDGVHLGLTEMGLLATFTISVMLLLSSLKKPVLNLAVGVFPMSMLALLFAIWGPTSAPSEIPHGLLSHIMTSLVAYSLIIIAACQAMLVAVQNYQLKHKHTRGIIQVLPPLQTMERLLFELICGGILALTLAIATGFVFIENLFAQHLAHKTVLTLMAWLVFAVLMGGHHLMGWRGMTAVRWTLGGTTLLVLGYFGSKFALEVLIN